MSKIEKKYFIELDIIRVLACFAILLYYLHILNGGYLAVCIFFVMSSYFSCIHAFKDSKFSILSYYKNRFIKVYFPLFFIVFITIALFSFLPNSTWFNLKPETTSVVLGFNNFWQLSANLDYFARAIHSPFIHFWYLAILIQFDILFPFLYLLLRKIGDKISKLLPCIITVILAIISFLYFYKLSFGENLLLSYYNTFARSFSLFLGLALGFIHSYYGSILKKEFKKNSKRIFGAYLAVLVFLFVFVSASSLYYSLSMLVVSLITCRMIEYGTLKPTKTKNMSFSKKLISFLSKISYEIYLIQYPVIFFFQPFSIPYLLKLCLIILAIGILSYLFHFVLSFQKKKKGKKILKILFCLFLFPLYFYGIYQHATCENHTEEMYLLEEQLKENEQMLKEKQTEYESHLKEEEQNWLNTVNDLENGEENLPSVVKNLPIVGIGDSVMLGAIDYLYETFPNGYIDAKVSRTPWTANGILDDLNQKTLINGPVVFNLGANGDCSETCRKQMIEKCQGNEVFWLTVTNDDVHINTKLKNFASQYENVHIIDWDSLSKGHLEYFYADGIHLTPEGRKAYTKAIYDAVYEVYLEKFYTQKEEILKKHEEELKNKISFYGNDLLLNGFSQIQPFFLNAQFNTKGNWKYASLKEELETAIQENTLHYKVVFVFDKNANLSSLEYQKLIEICKEHEIYILSMDQQITYALSKMNMENVTILNFLEEIQTHSEYLMTDQIHLTNEGNIALSYYLSDKLK